MNPRILFVEDSADDLELMLKRLREAGIEPQWDRVQTEAALREALAGERWELALVDYNLPGFGGLQALHVLAEVAPGVPAITVSGAITEETAVATITAGAVDYVLKDNLTRLAPAVQRAVEGADLRRRHRRSAEAARIALFAVDHASMSIMTVAADGIIIYVNDFACDEFGALREDMVGAKLWDYDQYASAATWPEIWKALKRTRVMEFEVDRVRSDGRRRIFDVAANYLEGAECLISYGRDITDRRLAEEQARESAALYRRIVELAAEGIWVTDGEYRTTLVNPQMARMLGYEVDEMIGRVITDFMLDEDLADHAAKMETGVKGGTGRYERGFKRKDGGEVWISVSSTTELGPEGEFLGSFALCTDITERRRMGEELRESERRYREFFATSRDSVLITSTRGEFIDSNDAALEMFGYDSREELFEVPISSLYVNPEERSVVLALIEKQGYVKEHPVQLRRRDGAVFDALITSGSGFRRNADGSESEYYGTIRDVTERNQAEEEVRRQAEQLRRTVEGAVLAMSHVVETRDPYTAGHERRVGELATAIGTEMGMVGEQLDALRIAGTIHDIGKIAVPAEILSKPGRLSEIEFGLIKGHPSTGFDILADVDFGRPVAEIVLQHHERLDGSGYPRALSGEDILPEARILAVADVVEAMSSHRPYRAALGMEAALAEVREHAGVKYDADVVATCVRLVKEQGFQFTP